MSEYNVANNKEYKWTSVNGSYLDEVPRIFAKSYLITKNDVISYAKAWVDNVSQTAGGGGIKYYDNLHDTTGAETDRWVFPFFNDDVRQITTSWGDSYVGSTNGTQSMFSKTAGAFKELASTVSTTIGQGQAILQGAPGALYEPPKFFNYGDLGEQGATVEFSLINTLGDNDYSKNYKLISRLIEINKLSRLSGNTAAPAALWEVTIPGYRKIKWASADVGIKLVGQRKMKDQKIIPEGYRVSITFKSLYTEPREFKSQYTDQL
jgi:hypothetical protein